MGVCFSFGSAPHPSSLNRSHYSSNSFSSGPANAEIISGSIHEHGEEYLRLPFPFPPRDGQILKWPDLKVFDFEELKSATMDFRLDLVVGEGDLGRVYKGWLDEDTLTPTNEGSGMVVAIKMLHPESMQGFIKWQSELNFLGRLDHPNLVKLLGYCWDDDDKFLIVYEFMEKGSLENNLFTRDPNLESLSWNTRLKIAIGVALGLTFLHASENPVIHRDLKPANILLDRVRYFLFIDKNYNAKISDFGLGKLGPSGGKTHVTTGVAGTYGYAAPEYRATGHLYVKSDRHEGS